MMEIATTVPEVLAACQAGFVPVNVDIGIAISAHQRCPCAITLYAVILACQPTVPEAQRQLDYLVGLSDAVWSVSVPNWEEHREATIAAIRRSIAWRKICA